MSQYLEDLAHGALVLYKLHHQNAFRLVVEMAEGIGTTAESEMITRRVSERLHKKGRWVVQTFFDEKDPRQGLDHQRADLDATRRSPVHRLIHVYDGRILVVLLPFNILHPVKLFVG